MLAGRPHFCRFSFCGFRRGLSSTPTPRSRGADYVWAARAKDELDGSVLHAIEVAQEKYAPTVLTRRASDGSDLEVVALRVLGREVELDQGHPQMILELLEGLRRAVLLPAALRVEGLEELRVHSIQS